MTDAGTAAAARCVVIPEDGRGAPPPSPRALRFNENSTRAASKKDRVYVLRAFLLRHFLPPSGAPPRAVLDVAGGKGDLSWLLVSRDAFPSFRTVHRSSLTLAPSGTPTASAPSSPIRGRPTTGGSSAP